MLCARSRAELENFVAAGRVHAVGRLVENQQLRIVDDGRGQLEPLLHAGGIRFDLAIAGLAQPDIVEHFVRPLQGILTRHADKLAGIGDELDADHLRKQALVFRREADQPADVELAMAKIHAQHFARAAIDRDQPEQRANHRRLAGTVRAEQTDRAERDADREIVERGDRAVGLGDAFELKQHANPRQQTSERQIWGLTGWQSTVQEFADRDGILALAVGRTVEPVSIIPKRSTLGDQAISELAKSLWPLYLEPG